MKRHLYIHEKRPVNGARSLRRHSSLGAPLYGKRRIIWIYVWAGVLWMVHRGSCVAACCSVLQHVAVAFGCCVVYGQQGQSVAVHCSVSTHCNTGQKAFLFATHYNTGLKQTAESAVDILAVDKRQNPLLTHCSTLWNTATHCNTLHHTTSHCNTGAGQKAEPGTDANSVCQLCCGAALERLFQVCCSVLQCVSVCCSVLQCVAVCCSALQCVAVCCRALQCAAVCCSVMQCAAECCSVVQRVAVCCSVLHACGLSQLCRRASLQVILHLILHRFSTHAPPHARLILHWFLPHSPLILQAQILKTRC